jgi:hypothetical protein
VRIPFYISGPGIAAGQQPEVMGVNIDVAPTLLALAGVKKPNQMDGHSLLPLIMGSAAAKAKATASWRTKTVIAFAEGGFQYWGDDAMPALNFPPAEIGQTGVCKPNNLEGSVALGFSACVSGLCNTKVPNQPRPVFGACRNNTGGGANYTFNNPENQWRMLRVTNGAHS